ncbi:MAG: four helix bundle protein [SAR202 cluster bacterium]|nr:diversity-generating retroelement protein bAvd family protein [Chloroflexota bacterium]MDP6419797.1 four helix bundle protein [SAR202 cluster bacterium]HAL46530.1 diversity-generating retroelement protein bAvd family protein [Dehalococcoidia bacterium]MDP6662592.1 four helix bundle protein [SAR202 cluster bacterium]MDP6798412.1 four helix bundle protein [SAR202 cluster bacterium]
MNRASPRDFRGLDVWRKSHELALVVYKATSGFPPSEQYGLTSQARRSAFSIPSNIAEGCGRGGDAEFARFCQIALGSASELEYQLLLAGELRYLSRDEHERLSSKVIEVKKMLTAFIRRIRSDRVR